jgi:hypothetical protein
MQKEVLNCPQQTLSAVTLPGNGFGGAERLRKKR